MRNVPPDVYGNGDCWFGNYQKLQVVLVLFGVWSWPVVVEAHVLHPASVSPSLSLSQQFNVAANTLMEASDSAAPPPQPTSVVADATETPATLPNTNDERGVCPVLQAYRRPAPQRVTLDPEGRTRGMNKGQDRERSELVQGTERPTLEGELNFFRGEMLQKIKLATRESRRTQDGVGEKRARGEGEVPGAVEVSDSTHDADADTHRVQSTEEGQRDAAALRAKKEALFRDKLVLAPLTTVGNLPFRRVCKGLGVDVTVSEMALVYNLNRLQKNEWSLLRRHESEDIFGIQIAVSRPQEASVFAKAIEASGFSYDFLDVNCGCPVDKIVTSGCGCGLWERKGRLREVVQNLTTGQTRPVSIKCRIGPDEESPLLHRQIAEYAGWGASSVTIHGRSRKQRYTKLANWDYVDECAKLTTLPVAGNGDILSIEDAEAHRQQHPHVSSLMIGRGALIKPWIFKEIKSGQVMDISSQERLEIIKEFASYGLMHWGADERGVMTTRRFLCEWLSFAHRYVPVGLLERLPQRINDRPPFYEGRNDLETLMASDSVTDWLKISELVLGPVEEKFRFTPKHKSNSYSSQTGGEEMEAEG